MEVRNPCKKNFQSLNQAIFIEFFRSRGGVTTGEMKLISMHVNLHSENFILAGNLVLNNSIESETFIICIYISSSNGRYSLNYYINSSFKIFIF